MNNMNTKKALAIDLPIMPNSKALITLMGNQKATTFIKKIHNVTYKESYIFITIETKNSIYKDIPVPIQPQDNFFDGQIIAGGNKVITSDGYYINISEILEVSENGIRIKDANNQEYIGAIYPIIYQ